MNTVFRRQDADTVAANESIDMNSAIIPMTDEVYDQFFEHFEDYALDEVFGYGVESSILSGEDTANTIEGAA